MNRVYSAIIALIAVGAACTPTERTDGIDQETALSGTVSVMCDPDVIAMLEVPKRMYDSVHPNAKVTLVPMDVDSAMLAMLNHEQRAAIVARDYTELITVSLFLFLETPYLILTLAGFNLRFSFTLLIEMLIGPIVSSFVACSICFVSVDSFYSLNIPLFSLKSAVSFVIWRLSMLLFGLRYLVLTSIKDFSMTSTLGCLFGGLKKRALLLQ